MIWLDKMASISQIHIMKGGFQDHFYDLFNKNKYPLHVITILFLTTLTVFIGKVPEEIRIQADTLFGRLFLIFLTLILLLLFGIPTGLLSAVFSVILIGSGGLFSGKENVKTEEAFSSESITRIIPDKHKWFNEKILGENPLLIEDNTVDTNAIQDLTEKGLGTSDVQNSNLSY